MIPSQLWFSQNFRFESGSVNQGVVSLDYPFHRLNVFYAVKIISILPLISHEAVWNSTKFGNQGEKKRLPTFELPVSPSVRMPQL